MHSPSLRRRGLIHRTAVVFAAAALAATACGAPDSGDSGGNKEGGVPDKPANAVTLNILDVAGNLQLTKPMIENFAKENPQIVSKANFQTGRAPDLAGKIKTQQDANSVDIDVVLTGTDGLAAGIDQNLWIDLLPQFDSRLKGSMGNYLPAAADMQKLAQGKGVTVSYYPSGPVLEYNPKKVANPPKTTAELLAWCKANPKKFQYAIPANSGPGRTLLMGLPYILKDSDPKDPEAGWDKTWSYLKEIESCAAPHPAGTGDTMKNIANGTVDIIASTTGWFLNPKVLGTVPAEMKWTTLEGFKWVTDAHYVVIPKGVSTDKQAAILQLIKFMLQPKQQAYNYGGLYFYPGPAVKDVPLSMAPQAMQDAAKKFDAAAFDPLIESVAKEPSLPAGAQVKAFAKWDREIGKK
jgi:putative spermidine/putrescine transport system substrate-binding protein